MGYNHSLLTSFSFAGSTVVVLWGLRACHDPRLASIDAKKAHTPLHYRHTLHMTHARAGTHTHRRIRSLSSPSPIPQTWCRRRVFGMANIWGGEPNRGGCIEIRREETNEQTRRRGERGTKRRREGRQRRDGLTRLGGSVRVCVCVSGGREGPPLGVSGMRGYHASHASCAFSVCPSRLTDDFPCLCRVFSSCHFLFVTKVCDNGV